MGTKIVQSSARAIWALVERQHGVVSRAQLLARGLSSEAIKHRVATGRLHPVHRGVYAVGRPDLPREGRWLAAVLACGAGALLSHRSAAALRNVIVREGPDIEVSVPAVRVARRPGVKTYRRSLLEPEHADVCCRIPVTSPFLTMVDLATVVSLPELEKAVNEADKLGVVSFEALASWVERAPQRPGMARLRRLIGRATFRLTDSELERRFLPLVRRAGLPLPRTRKRVEGYRTDFFWPELGLVVETDGLRYHRTPAQQTRDRLRDQKHMAAGLVPLRFTHAQVRFEPGHVIATLTAVASRRSRR